MPQNNLRPVLSIDLGGTNIKSAIVLPDGEISYFKSYPTQADRGPEEVVTRIIFAIKDTMAKTGLKIRELYGIAIASAGILDVKNGIITSSPSLPGWHNIPLRDIMAEKLGLTVHL